MHFEAPDPLVEIQRVLHEVVGLPANSPDGFELKRLAGCYVLTAEGLSFDYLTFFLQIPKISG